MDNFINGQKNTVIKLKIVTECNNSLLQFSKVFPLPDSTKGVCSVIFISHRVLFKSGGKL